MNILILVVLALLFVVFFFFYVSARKHEREKQSYHNHIDGQHRSTEAVLEKFDESVELIKQDKVEEAKSALADAGKITREQNLKDREFLDKKSRSE